MRIMLLGDTHGNRGFTKSAISMCTALAIDQIIQLGDFGYWPRINPGQTFLHDVGKAAWEADIPLWFIDGNHEDHLVLQPMADRQNGLVKITSTLGNGKEYPVFYVPRGHTWTWDGLTFGAFGGAFSIDRSVRHQDAGRWGWFANEMPDRSRIEALGKVDILLTHDSPIVPPGKYGTGYKEDATSRTSQDTVYDALLASKARLVVHGHWHHYERYKVHGALVQALGADVNGSLPHAALVVDTETRKVYTLNEWAYRSEETGWTIPK